MEEKSDPSFVEWTAYVKEVNASGKFYTYFEMHKCDENDFKHFHPPSKQIEKTISNLKEKKILWCLDPSDIGALYGRRTMDNFRKVSF